MIVSSKMSAGLDGNGNARRVWSIHWIGNGGQCNLVGFVDYGQYQWPDVRKAFPDVVMLSDIETTPKVIRDLRRLAESPDRLRAIADAMEGN